MVAQVAIDAVNHYLSKGYTKDAAVGVVSVLYAGESQLKTGPQMNAATDHPGVLTQGIPGAAAYGIAGWNGPVDKSKIGDPRYDRQAALQTFAQAKGEPVDNLNTQLDFVSTEAANDYPQVWAAIQNPATTWEQMIDVFTEHYEIPANPSAEEGRAKTFGQQLYATIGAVTPPVTPAPTPTPAPVPAPTPVPSQSPPPLSADAELSAMGDMWNQLAPFIGDRAAVSRILGWLTSRAQSSQGE